MKWIKARTLTVGDIFTLKMELYNRKSYMTTYNLGYVVGANSLDGTNSLLELEPYQYVLFLRHEN